MSEIDVDSPEFRERLWQLIVESTPEGLGWLWADDEEEE
jgi:hypothetical protein